MADFNKLYNLIPFGTELAKIHHAGFIIPSSINDIELNSICDKACTIDILKSEVGYKKFNNTIIEIIKPTDERSILYKSSEIITEITFDHFGYLKSDFPFENFDFIKISKFYTCLFKTEVEFILNNTTKIEIVHDNI